ncbi:DUF5107 domain-containing protein [Ruania halotolerans]|uniref:DUF5107 domain-containing protein n=1 Tax=Ruania halotolerans TaxID=2897773 RepID=UPI001E51168E|nr:DUF5107 domain-containing protein [Ruania halotolerans]UFU07720.1 DUF5107 domain-containing protein [Ruania halotolerans]
MLTEEPTLTLPARPGDQADAPVAVWREPLPLRTYHPAPPSDLPAYLDGRVYQGSSGRVYPLPFHDRIESEPTTHQWDAIHLENAWIRLVILPELGGRIHLAIDRHSGAEIFYNNPVIKPALVGLAGPWIAGGIELNWPQHHRPATYLPTDTHITHEDDGSVTVWCSDHDPFDRMKGMHGVRLRPDRSTIELRVRLYNRTPLTQTFLWWANVAARTHRDFQSFFPSDVHIVADHAKRAITAFPAADRPYYDIDYPSRAHHTFTAADGALVSGDRIDWPDNIPVPTSYMVTHSDHDFFGGYDHATSLGFVHVADRRIAVGKKQWTWGESRFGRAWNRNLADDDSAYVELMAGVFTDNQPDFAFLAPGETKVFSQVWYPLRDIGPVTEATEEAALRVRLAGGTLAIGVISTSTRPGALLEVLDPDGTVIADRVADLDPATPVQWEVAADGAAPLTVRVRHGEQVLVSQPTAQARQGEQGEQGESVEVLAATEPAPPAQVDTVEELLDIAGHLQQYRHASRSPEPYWAEALRREPGHAGVSTAVGIARLRQGRLGEAETHLRTAVGRLTAYHPTPSDVTALYHLGLVLALGERPQEAYGLFARASWNRLWRAPAGYEMARLDATARRDTTALHRLDDVLRVEPEHLQARTLRALLLRRTGRTGDAAAELAALAGLDPLHWWSRDLAGQELHTDALTCLDIASEYASVGCLDEALRVMETAVDRDRGRALGQPSVTALAHLHRADLLERSGDEVAAQRARQDAAGADRTWCFPGRLEDAVMLTRAVQRHQDAVAQVLLGHWLYASGRQQEALTAWETGAREAGDAVVHRNIGLALVTEADDLDGARAAYDRALALAPGHPRILRESDQLDRRRAMPVAARLRAISDAPQAVAERDDLAAELAHLLVCSGDAVAAHRILSGRQFQPWEGGEGEVLRVWERTCTALARTALTAGRLDEAAQSVAGALTPPATLGEDRHPLATTAGLQLLTGDVAAAAGRTEDAERAWSIAAAQVGDFRTMSASRHSEATYHSVLALRRLGRADEARALAADLRAFTDELAASTPGIDYFATSLPEMLLFPPDLSEQRDVRVQFLRAQLDLLDGDMPAARALLTEILTTVPDHPEAHDLLATIEERE